MSENYIVINGKKAELTKEQVKVLGIEPEKKRNNPFEKVNDDEKYYYVDHFGEIVKTSNDFIFFNKKMYDAANYFNDEAFAKQVALHQLLYRKLLKFVYDNGYEDTAEWDSNNPHWCISYSAILGELRVDVWYGVKFPGVWFSSPESAKRALEEVAKPFIKGHPEFKW